MGEAWASLDFGLQRTLPDIDFPPSRPSSSSFSISLHFGPLFPLSLFLSFSLCLEPHRVAFGFLVALIALRVLSFRFARPFIPPSSSFLVFLFIPLRSEGSSERRPIWRHRTKCVKARRDPQRHTRSRNTHTHDLVFSSRVRHIFNLPQGGRTA